MRHSEARELLVDWEHGALEPSTRTDVATHVESCATCRDWLDTYRLLATALGPAGAGAAGHPQSELLARWAVRPHEVEAREQERLQEHLRSCPECHRAMTVVPEALFEAKRPVSRLRGALSPGWLQRAALAAGLATLVVGGALWLRARTAEPVPGAPPMAEVFGPGSQEGTGEHLSGVELDGTRTIQGERRLTLTDVEIPSGSSITLRAEERIAFGNGVRIGPGTKVAIEISGAGSPSPAGAGDSPRSRARHPRRSRSGS